MAIARKNIFETAFYTFADPPEKAALRTVLAEGKPVEEGKVCLILRPGMNILCAPQLTSEDACSDFKRALNFPGATAKTQDKADKRTGYDIVTVPVDY